MQWPEPRGLIERGPPSARLEHWLVAAVPSDDFLEALLFGRCQVTNVPDEAESARRPQNPSDLVERAGTAKPLKRPERLSRLQPTHRKVESTRPSLRGSRLPEPARLAHRALPYRVRQQTPLGRLEPDDGSASPCRQRGRGWHCRIRFLEPEPNTESLARDNQVGSALRRLR